MKSTRLKLTQRAERINAFLRHPAPVREPLGHELRGPVVQLLASGTTDPTWTAAPEVYAAALDADLTAAEEKDIPTGSTTAGGLGTAFTPHALVITRSTHDFVGTCACGRAIGRTPQGRSLDGLVGHWEQHAAQADPDATWADALTSLHPTSIGAS